MFENGIPDFTALIQCSPSDGMPIDLNCHSAYDGFARLGYEIALEKTGLYPQAEDVSPREIPVGGLGFVRSRLRALGVPIEEIDYPEPLAEAGFLGRALSSSMMSDIRQGSVPRPIFVKPRAKAKSFTGLVVSSQEDLLRVSHVPDDEPVWVSEPVRFLCEWRAYVADGGILGAHRYSPYSDWRARETPSLDIAALDRMVAAFEESGEAPRGYSLDVGTTDDGRLLLVEVNDGYSLGCYGLDSALYARLLASRWEELVADLL